MTRFHQFRKKNSTAAGVGAVGEHIDGVSRTQMCHGVGKNLAT